MIPVLAATANVLQPHSISSSFLAMAPSQENLHFWLNPRLGHTKDGSDKVSRWEDLSYHTGQEATQSDGPRQPIWYPSGSAQNLTFISHSFIEFDGAGLNGDYLLSSLSSHITGAAHTFAIAFAEIGGSGLGFRGYYCEAQDGLNDFQNSGSFAIMNTGSANTSRIEHNLIIEALPLNEDIAHILIGTFDGAVSKWYLDGVDIPSVEFSSSTDFDIFRVILGARQSNPLNNIDRHAACQLSEVAIYGKALEGEDSMDRIQLYNYFTASISGTL